MDREEAIKFLQEHVKTEVLMRHLLGVEAAMRSYARRYGGDEDRWGIAGLVHDFDWEIVPHPEDHPVYGASLLEDAGFPGDIIRAVLTHGDHTNIPRESIMEKTLFAVDELSGFIRAVALVRPSKSLEDVTSNGVLKKMKDKGFARDVNRDDITKGAQEIGLELDEHISFIIESLKPIAAELGLVVEASS